ncbi:hypothetical protein HHI36_017504 [Cryptolaemus montrouzieri]|uniref:Solute carrier family 46 member 3 n=1 Tax=Cryptolaemus montrouzieri TaxID=559131 RepID=A0ABD2NMK4_9CUCU
MSEKNGSQILTRDIEGIYRPKLNSEGIIGKLKYVLFNISVEPLIFCYLLPSVMNYLVCQNLYLEKACRVNLGYSSSTCDAMSNRNVSGYTEEQEMQVQKLVSKMVAIKTLVPGIFPVCLIIFLGAWSDRHGRRKPLILAPIVGEMIGCFLLILSVIFFYEIPLLVTVLADSLPHALAGGYPCLFLGIYSYISSVSTEKNRTARIGAVSTIQNATMIMGMSASGFVMKAFGFTTMYSISATMMLTAFVYGWVVLKDKRIVSIENNKTKLAGKASSIKRFFDFKNIMGVFQVCFKNGAGNRKHKMIGVMLLSVIILGPFSGEYPVLYLYTRYKFGWNEMDYSIYFIVQAMIQIFGSVIALLIFSKLLKWQDSALGIVALVSAIFARVVYAFAPSGVYFYLGAVIELFYLTCHIAVRSLMGKIVPPEELGQTYSIFGICEALMGPIFSPLYTMIYTYTIDYFPGAFFLVTSCIKVVGVFIFIWMYREIKKDEKYKSEAKAGEIEKLNRTEDKDDNEAV